jgi:hypothetical protein
MIRIVDGISMIYDANIVQSSNPMLLSWRRHRTKKRAPTQNAVATTRTIARFLVKGEASRTGALQAFIDHVSAPDADS